MIACIISSSSRLRSVAVEYYHLMNSFNRPYSSQFILPYQFHKSWSEVRQRNAHLDRPRPPGPCRAPLHEVVFSSNIHTSTRNNKKFTISDKVMADKTENRKRGRVESTSSDAENAESEIEARGGDDSEPSVSDVNDTSSQESATSSKKSRSLGGDKMSGYFLRNWQWLKPFTSIKEGHQFSYMSYNILAQKLLEANRYLYGHVKPKYLTWKHRGEYLSKEIQNYRPDIICLQEMQEDHFHNSMMPKLEAFGYKGIFKKRTGDKPDGLAIIYNRYKFEMEKFMPVEYFISNKNYMDRDNVGLVALLNPVTKDSRCVHPSARICVGTTHLLFNPRRGDIKLGQLSMFLSAIDDIAYKGKNAYHPIILCGDMNSKPFSPLYDLLIRGELDFHGYMAKDISWQKGSGRSRNLQLNREIIPPRIGIYDQCQFAKTVKNRTDAVKDEKDVPVDENDYYGLKKENSLGSGTLYHQFNLASVYDHFKQTPRGLLKEVTTYHQSDQDTVDYIMYSVKEKSIEDFDSEDWYRVGDLKYGKLQLLGRLELMDSSQVSDHGGLPNKYHCSDHLPLMAKFLLS